MGGLVTSWSARIKDQCGLGVGSLCHTETTVRLRTPLDRDGQRELRGRHPIFAPHIGRRRTSARARRAYSIMMMVGLAFFDLNIVAAGIVSNAPMMLAKLSSTIIWKYSMKLLPRTPCVSHLEVASIDTRSQIWTPHRHSNRRTAFGSSFTSCGHRSQRGHLNCRCRSASLRVDSLSNAKNIARSIAKMSFEIATLGYP